MSDNEFRLRQNIITGSMKELTALRARCEEQVLLLHDRVGEIEVLKARCEKLEAELAEASDGYRHRMEELEAENELLRRNNAASFLDQDAMADKVEKLEAENKALRKLAGPNFERLINDLEQAIEEASK